METRINYRRDLEELQVKFVQMGERVGMQIADAVSAFKGSNLEVAHQVIKEDLTVNEIERDLQESAIQLIALQQPVAKDLRYIITIMKASTDLERIGDHATNIAQAALNQGEARLSPAALDLLDQMAGKLSNMLEQNMAAFETRDSETAIQVANSDAEVDQLANQFRKVLLEDVYAASEYKEETFDMMTLGNNLERIGDYITNLSEWIVYLDKAVMPELNPNP